jgi:hypothetical protein
MTNYRMLYNESKRIVCEANKAEIHEVMSFLGYVKAEKKAKAKDTKKVIAKAK